MGDGVGELFADASLMFDTESKGGRTGTLEDAAALLFAELPKLSEGLVAGLIGSDATRVS
jgi:hypothetical protein